MSIENEIRTIVAEQLGVDLTSVKNESKFVLDLGADSLDTVELIMAIEDRFGLEIADDDAEKIVSVQDAIDYVTTNKK